MGKLNYLFYVITATGIIGGAQIMKAQEKKEEIKVVKETKLEELPVIKVEVIENCVRIREDQIYNLDCHEEFVYNSNLERSGGVNYKADEQVYDNCLHLNNVSKCQYDEHHLFMKKEKSGINLGINFDRGLDGLRIDYNEQFQELEHNEEKRRIRFQSYK